MVCVKLRQLWSITLRASDKSLSGRLCGRQLISGRSTERVRIAVVARRRKWNRGPLWTLDVGVIGSDDCTTAAGTDGRPGRDGPAVDSLSPVPVCRLPAGRKAHEVEWQGIGGRLASSSADKRKNDSETLWWFVSADEIWSSGCAVSVAQLRSNSEQVVTYDQKPC